ncbi:hypothetical protein CK203_031144 [Vitis vinifera]|uniref:Chromo domain-containing protein n=1 Tax=Vitis vinifera TaxID=29760 RepID=A0A438J0L3_VITVI|nr:hypothetical protein CK203_031144 [Vitis vinifera]
MTVIVHCLRTWRHYLLGFHFIVKTYNVATSYFQTQKKLSLKQARWQDFLAEFNYTLEYKLGSANHVADALSLAKSLITLAHEGKTKRFWVEDDLLYTKGRRLYMPKWGNIRQNLIKECHDTKFSKYATFIAASTDCTAEETTRLFLKHVVKYWGLPKYIISDCDPRFTQKFWTELFKLMGLELHFSQMGKLRGLYGRSPTTIKFANGWHKQADIARSHLDKMAKKIKKWANKKRRHTEYKVGDMVGKVSYRVELSPRLKIHPVFHTSYLKPYHEDKDNPNRGFSKRASTAVVTSYDKEVEHIIADRVIRRRGVPPATEYLVKWKGLP